LPLTEWQVDGEIWPLEESVFSFEEALKQEVEVRCGDGEGGSEEVLHAMLHLMS
jgi:hypothetical protein